jgi:hypothetical protein
MEKVIVNTKEELVSAIENAIINNGYGADLNFIDTSRIDDSSCKRAR